jgi:ABC-type amino acid transport substrate-binding protein
MNGSRRLLVASLLLGLVPGVRADFAEIASKGTLVILVSADENPAWFSLKASGPPGFERSVLEGFARLHKLRLDVAPVQRWEDAIPDLLKGRGDVIAGMNDTPARRQHIDFTAELVPSQHVVVNRKPRSAIQTVEELRAARVGVIPGTTWAEAVAAAGVPSSQVRSYEDVEKSLEALRSAQITATVMDVADFLLQRRADTDLQDGMNLGPGLSGAWGVRKSDPNLRHQLDDYLENLKKSPTWSRVVVEYFGEDALRLLGRSHP